MVGVYNKARKAIERLYEGKCTVYAREKSTDPESKETIFTEVVKYSDVPCRLSFGTYPTTNIQDHAPQLAQSTKLFVAPELSLPAGSKITVTQNGVTEQYAMSGQPAMYATHQEISLELFKRWA